MISAYSALRRHSRLRGRGAIADQSSSQKTREEFLSRFSRGEKAMSATRNKQQQSIAARRHRGN